MPAWIGVTLRVKPLTWGHESSSGLPRIWGMTVHFSKKAKKDFLSMIFLFSQLLSLFPEHFLVCSYIPATERFPFGDFLSKMHFIECLAVRELVTTPFHGLRWCSPHARVPVLNQLVSNPRRCCCRIWSPPTLERRVDCGGLGGGACVVWRWCMWVWVRWWRWWKSGCVWRRGACEMVWPCVHRYGMCVVWEVWVTWCGRVCMGVGEMRKRVMAVCAWCMWVWESGWWKKEKMGLLLMI